MVVSKHISESIGKGMSCTLKGVFPTMHRRLKTTQWFGDQTKCRTKWTAYQMSSQGLLSRSLGEDAAFSRTFFKVTEQFEEQCEEQNCSPIFLFLSKDLYIRWHCFKEIVLGFYFTSDMQHSQQLIYSCHFEKTWD